jgi:hypothetical protein
MAFFGPYAGPGNIFSNNALHATLTSAALSYNAASIAAQFSGIPTLACRDNPGMNPIGVIGPPSVSVPGPYTGTSTATTTTTLTATGTPWTANAFIGCIVSSGASTGYITSNTTSALTVSGWNGGTPATGAFTIYQTKFNPYPYDVTVYISGGTVSFIGLGTSNTVYTTALVSGAFRLKPGACIALNYSAAPYWVWVAE